MNRLSAKHHTTSSTILNHFPTRSTSIHPQTPLYLFTIGIQAILSKEGRKRTHTKLTQWQRPEIYSRSSNFFLLFKQTLARILLAQVIPNILKLCIFDVGRGLWGTGIVHAPQHLLCPRSVTAVSRGIFSQSPRYRMMNLSEYRRPVIEYRRPISEYRLSQTGFTPKMGIRREILAATKGWWHHPFVASDYSIWAGSGTQGGPSCTHQTQIHTIRPIQCEENSPLFFFFLSFLFGI